MHGRVGGAEISAGALLASLREIVGRRHVLTGAQRTRRFRMGYRYGEGAAAAVVRPGRLVELWRVLQACVAADRIVIMQAANTGLTGGSSPHGDDYDREVVIVSTQRLSGIHPIDGGRQVVCLPGATLHQLEALLRPLGREPHSVIGSSCIGASVLGGVCNSSGGSLVRRGPAYTELALYAQRTADGRLRLVNHLGIALGDDPEAMLDRLERGAFSAADIAHDPTRRASDGGYAAHVREVDAPTPARFNADPARLHEASGCAGKLALFAVRLDSFPAERETRVFYVGTNDPAVLTGIRRHLLSAPGPLPIAGEYLHRDAFDVADRYGKDGFVVIDRLGTARLPAFFAAKARVDAAAARLRFLPANLTDRLLQRLAGLLPDHLPPRMRAFRDRYEHHLMLTIAADGVEDTRAFLSRHLADAEGDMFVCDADEGRKAFLHRFVAAGAAVRYRAVHADEVEEIVALDIALRRNDPDWLERLPPELDAKIAVKLYYGHFLCHVFHQDYVVRKGVDWRALEHAMWALLDARGAEYPAEHNVGHLYHAKPALSAHYAALDPRNSFNPGIGGTSKRRNWA